MLVRLAEHSCTNMVWEVMKQIESFGFKGRDRSTQCGSLVFAEKATPTDLNCSVSHTGIFSRCGLL